MCPFSFLIWENAGLSEEARTLGWHGRVGNLNAGSLALVNWWLADKSPASQQRVVSRSKGMTAANRLKEAVSALRATVHAKSQGS